MKDLSARVREARGVRGIRAVAEEVGVSYATLSRVEAGKTPDLDTFKKLCAWLKVEPNELLGVSPSAKSPSSGLEFGDSMGQVFAHFRAKKTMSQDTAGHLANLIQAINKEL